MKPIEHWIRQRIQELIADSLDPPFARGSRKPELRELGFWEFFLMGRFRFTADPNYLSAAHRDIFLWHLSDILRISVDDIEELIANAKPRKTLELGTGLAVSLYARVREQQVRLLVGPPGKGQVFSPQMRLPI